MADYSREIIQLPSAIEATLLSSSTMFDTEPAFATDTHNLVVNYSGSKYVYPAMTAGTTLTAGGILFSNSSGNITQDVSNLFWDDSNNRLGIGTNAPSTTLHLVGHEGFRYVDTHQSAGYVLTCDANGVAAWTEPGAAVAHNVFSATHGDTTGAADPVLGDIIYSNVTPKWAKLAGNTTTAKQYLSQTGTGAVSAAPAWATIAGADITGAALTKSDDTNVTLTLGGTPTTALLRATSLTLGWSGQLAVGRGGTGASTLALNGVLYGNGTSAVGVTAIGAAGQILRVGADPFVPAWSTATYPNTATAYRLLVATATNVIGELAAVGATGEYLAGATGAIPAWATLNQAAIAGLTTTDGPTFDHIHTSNNSTMGTINSTTIPSSKTLTVTTDTLAVFAATTSAQLAGVISDETGSGALMFGTSPTITTSLLISDGAYVGQVNGPKLTFDDASNYLEISGCTVGIGSTAPEYSLDIIGDGSTTTGDHYVTKIVATAVGTGIYFGYNATSPTIDGSLMRVNGSTQLPFTLRTYSVDDVITVLDAGYVGIGTSDPGTYQLYIGGTLYTSGAVTLGSTLSGATAYHTTIYALTSSGLSFYDDGGNLGIKIKDGGNVGIGTSDPGYNLHVAKDANQAISLQFTNSTVGHTSDDGLLVGIFAAGGAYVWQQEASTLEFATSNTSRVSIASGGDVTFTEDIIMTDGKSIGQAAGPLITFDDTSDYLEITGCNVGIGTTVPNAKLEIYTPTRGELLRLNHGAVGPHAGLSLWEDATGAFFLIGANAYLTSTPTVVRYDTDVAGWYMLANSFTGDEYFKLNHINAAGTDENFITVLSDGNVGIGTTVPGAKLHVIPPANTEAIRADGWSLTGSDTHNLVYLQGSANTTGVFHAVELNITDYAHGTNSSLMNLKVDSVSKFFVGINGFVGIGTTIPGAPLDICSDSGMFLGVGDDLQITISSDNIYFKNATEDKSIYFQVNDGGSTTTPLTIAGNTSRVLFNLDDGFYLGAGSDLQVIISSDNVYFKQATQDKDIYFQVNDGGSTTTPLFIQGSTSNVGIGTTNPTYGKFCAQSTAGTGQVVLDAFQEVPSGISGMSIYCNATVGIIEVYESPNYLPIQLNPNGSGVIIRNTAFVGSEVFRCDGDAYFDHDVSALTFTDRTPMFVGDALSLISKIKALPSGELDHSTLPEFALVKKMVRVEKAVVINGETFTYHDMEETPFRNMGNMLSLHTVAIQQLSNMFDPRDKKISELESKVKTLEAEVIKLKQP